MAMLAYGYSHQVVLAGCDTVLLEIAGSRRLLGSSRTLIDALCRKARQRGFVVRSGLAPVAAATPLLARHGKHCPDLSSLKQTLRQTPIADLDILPETKQAMTGCGLYTIGELMHVPVADRTRRFGAHLNDDLAGLFGHRPVPLPTWQPPEHYRQRLELPAATADTGALLFIFRRAIEHLGDWLEVRDHALTQLHARLEREDGGTPEALDIGLARPGLDPERLLELIDLKLDRLKLAAPVTGVIVSAETTAAHRPPQSDLFSGHNRADAWPALLDRLNARLGKDGLASLAPVADHRPEKSWTWTTPGVTAPGNEQRPRPLWLFPEPRPCRRDSLQLQQGPERIESGWWDGPECRRDYWIAKDRHGRHLWVFHEHHPGQGWFVHGLLDI
jgi:protein ImuB